MNICKTMMLTLGLSLTISVVAEDKKTDVKNVVTPAKKVEKVAPKKRAPRPKPDSIVEIKILNGHLGKVRLAMSTKATDKYDRGLDEMAPPPGMQTGYTALVAPDQSAFLYTDCRKTADEVDYVFYAKVYSQAATGKKPAKSKPVTISWDKKKLFKGYTMKIFVKGKEKLDMSKVNSYTFTETDGIVIEAKKTQSIGKTVPAKKITPAKKVKK